MADLKLIFSPALRNRKKKSAVFCLASDHQRIFRCSITYRSNFDLKKSTWLPEVSLNIDI